jgi:2-hydroxy-6-oxonona-2,4-dienedioate hydrolase
VMRRKLILGAVALIVVAAGAVAATYLRDTRRAYARTVAKGAVITSPYGDIEYSEGGTGPAVLVIHGGGGGYDQGEILVETVLGDDFRWIAPSRFGYLRSGLPDGATWDDQANAFAYLLDQLGIETVAVVALSQGGPSALLLAMLHPERVSSLTCLSCGVAPSISEDQAEANQKGDLLRTVFGRDYLYWPISRYFKRQLMGVLGASPEVVASLTVEQREIIERLIDHMNPAAPRSAGVVLDNEARLPGDRVAAVRAPTLIVHARDDGLQLYHNAEFAAATIPGATLMSFDRGGHVVIAVERAAVRAAVRDHILAHVGTAPAARP